MRRLLAEQIGDQEGRPVEWNGQLAYLTFAFDDIPDHVSVQFESASAGVRQGVVVSCQGADLVCEETPAPKLIFWTDAAPPVVELYVKRRSRAPVRSLLIWNVWMNTDILDAWTGNGGIVIEHISDNAVRLHCSNGLGSVDFENLVVLVQWSHRPDAFE